MAEGVSMSPEDAAAARAAEQARLRKERREAKIKAGGASRLNKISGLVGGVPKEVEPTTSASPQPSTTVRPQPASASHGDPEEVDISQHYYQPTTTPRVPTPQQPQQRQQQSGTPDLSEDALRQMMLGFDGNPGGGPPGDDMLLQMMMQSLGGGAGSQFPFPPGGGPGGGGAQNNPFANMMLPGMGQQPGGGGTPPEAAVPDRYASLWRLLHTAVALGLGLYIALWTSFSGTKVDRDLSGANAAAGSPAGAEKMLLDNNDSNAEMARKFFWAFATAEAVLLTTRFFMDRGRAPPQGLLGTLVGFLPGKIGNYVKIGLQYGQIFSTVKADILVCVFVLGACSWLRS